MQPATKHVRWGGYTIPAYDYMLAGEVEQLELLLMNRTSMTDFQQDLECFLICLRHRVPEHRTLTREDVAKVRLTPKVQTELSEAVGVLIAPFFDMRRERERRKGREMMKYLSPEKLEEEIALMEVILAELKSMQRAGRASATPSSSPTG